ncbi:MAG: leucine-rich repeat domain-containing protein [Treponema sp.]|jgi:hypothetical protein|nr:leucine-rich repeat domain-containing protein [Treponema sp.]
MKSVKLKEIVLIFAFVFIIAVQGFAQQAPEGLEFEIVDGKSVTIKGYTGNASTIDIPERIQGLPVTVIEDWAFNGYSHLTSITIPPSVTSIGSYAFSFCDSLVSITIPPSVTSIGNAAFMGCNSLTSITVDSRNTAYASLDGVLFDKTIRTIIIYPPGKNTSTYIVPSSVTSIGDRAFFRCDSLTSMSIPSHVTSIGDGAFAGCRSLASITVDSRNPAYTSIDDVLFDKAIRTIIAYPVGKDSRTYTIPSSITTIGEQAFSYCENLTDITIPPSVTSIGNGAFSFCYVLASINIPSSITTIRDETFACCYSLTSISIPSSITSIGDGAFYNCSNLTSIDIPSSVTSIGNGAFYRCYNLRSITLSRRTRVSEDSFYDSVELKYRD